MKYLKLFENYNNSFGKYWKIRIEEPYFSRSIKYLNEKYDCPIGKYDFLKKKNCVEILVIHNESESPHPYEWDWDVIDDEDALNDDGHHFEYMGSFGEATPEDIERMELERQTRKYNL